MRGTSAVLRSTVWCALVALATSVGVGAALSVPLSLVTLATMGLESAISLPEAVLAASSFLIICGCLGAVVGVLPTFVVGLPMALLSVFRPAFRRASAWIGVGAVFGFMLPTVFGLFPAADASEELAAGLALAVIAAFDAILFRHWTLRKVERIWKPATSDANGPQRA